MSQIFLFVRKGANKTRAEGRNSKPFEKKFARLAARAVFVNLVLLQKQLIFDVLTQK